MILPKCKRGLNRRGHLLFSLGLASFLIYFLSHYIEIPYSFLIFHVPFFLFGAILPDLIERPTDIWHRGLIHKGFWLLLIPLTMLILYSFWPASSKFSFLNISFNYYSIRIFILAGWLTHLLGDSLTSKLR